MSWKGRETMQIDSKIKTDMMKELIKTSMMQEFTNELDKLSFKNSEKEKTKISRDEYPILFDYLLRNHRDKVKWCRKKGLRRRKICYDCGEPIEFGEETKTEYHNGECEVCPDGKCKCTKKMRNGYICDDCKGNMDICCRFEDNDDDE